MAGVSPLAGLSAGLPPGCREALSAWLIDHARAEQRHFGSAVYMPLTDGALYRVIMTQGGLNAESVNPIARDAVARKL